MMCRNAPSKALHSSPWAFYLEMYDGVKCAVDLYQARLLDNLCPSPVIIEFTRYWRASSAVYDRPEVLFFVGRGFHYARVDVRGSGASAGYRKAEIGIEEVKDFSIIIEWIGNQAWCNGAVITQGVSYVGNTAEIALLDAPVALKASLPQFTDFDLYAHLLFPGGLPNIGFLEPWSEGVGGLDLNCPSASIPVLADLVGRGVKPVDTDEDGDLLSQSIKEHHKNTPVAEQLADITYRDDLESEVLSLESNDPCHWVSPYQLRNNLRWQEVPSFHWASFADAGTAAGAIARFMCSPAPMRVVIGYWSHGLNHDANPFHPKDVPVVPNCDQCWSAKEAFLRPLKYSNKDVSRTKLLDERALYYFTAGQDFWKKTSTWPPAGTEMQCWYFHDGFEMSRDMPDQAQGADKYVVNFDVGTGSFGRWYQMDAVHYGDRAEADKLLLTYTSLPLEQGIELTGHPVVHLQMSSTETDGALIVYLEAVAPDGTVIMLTEGNLRLQHRKVSREIPPYPIFGPYHTFKKKDSKPMPLGLRTPVKFVMLPLSVQVKKGYSLRIAIAGADINYFKRIPEKETPIYSIYRQASAMSYVELPVLPIKDYPRVDPFKF